MKRKLIIPAIAATVLLTGCSAGGLDAIQADVELLKREVAELKGQSGNPVGNSSTENPAASSGTTSTVAKGNYGLGEQIVVEGVTYTVTEAERKQQLSDGIKASEGYEFATYNVHIHNTSNDDYRYSQSFFSIVTSSGEIKDNYLILDFGDKLDELGSGDLAPNGKSSGWVAFEVPQGDLPLEFRFEKKSFTKNDGASFKIKLR